METLSIVLKINGENKTFETDFISIDTLESVFDLADKSDALGYRKMITAYIDLLVKIFNEQFTKEDIRKGIDARALIAETTRLIEQITADFSGK